MMRRACALLLAGALAAPAAAQTTKQAAPPAERPASERPALNLKLDRPGSWAQVAPEAEKERGNLPTLGGDARPIPTTPPPLPKDTLPGR